jgi:hypothetical protein
VIDRILEGLAGECAGIDAGAGASFRTDLGALHPREWTERAFYRT